MSNIRFYRTRLLTTALLCAFVCTSLPLDEALANAHRITLVGFGTAARPHGLPINPRVRHGSKQQTQTNAPWEIPTPRRNPSRKTEQRKYTSCSWYVPANDLTIERQYCKLAGHEYIEDETDQTRPRQSQINAFDAMQKMKRQSTASFCGISDFITSELPKQTNFSSSGYLVADTSSLNGKYFSITQSPDDSHKFKNFGLIGASISSDTLLLHYYDGHTSAYHRDNNSRQPCFSDGHRCFSLVAMTDGQRYCSDEKATETEIACAAEYMAFKPKKFVLVEAMNSDEESTYKSCNWKTPISLAELTAAEFRSATESDLAVGRSLASSRRQAKASGRAAPALEKTYKSQDRMDAIYEGDWTSLPRESLDTFTVIYVRRFYSKCPRSLGAKPIVFQTKGKVLASTNYTPGFGNRIYVERTFKEIVTDRIEVKPKMADAYAYSINHMYGPVVVSGLLNIYGLATDMFAIEYDIDLLLDREGCDSATVKQFENRLVDNMVGHLAPS